MTLTFEPVQVAAGLDLDGQLVFTKDRRLVALLTRLSDDHGHMAGNWFFEVGFGSLEGPDRESGQKRWSRPVASSARKGVKVERDMTE